MEGGQKKKTQKNETKASRPSRRYANHRGMKSSVQNKINHLGSEGNDRFLKSDVGTSKKKVASALLITAEQGPECQVQEASFTKQPSNVIKQEGRGEGGWRSLNKPRGRQLRYSYTHRTGLNCSHLGCFGSLLTVFLINTSSSLLPFKLTKKSEVGANFLNGKLALQSFNYSARARGKRKSRPFQKVSLSL